MAFLLKTHKGIITVVKEFCTSLHEPDKRIYDRLISGMFRIRKVMAAAR